ncbi:Casparian strip membrane protein domain [Arabidopsis thaliana x Arabidopsis arenosa]|uniref:CASP-like protein n=1 Tax=Arabidopsis thaliana x Arabidopsis arenosa TaxID=1240361 RepID=A0A8T1XVX6_9BRAS|nr:Casparian strip membrane protein domain [Arabidopsis thaliana x Arabidopsis arenosa]
MKRTASSNSEAYSYNESPHSPLRFHSPLSDAGDLPESRYVSPEGSPFKIENPKSIVSGNKLTQFSPLPSPIPPPPPQFPPPRRQRNARVPMNSSSDKSPSSMVVHNSWVREDGQQTTTRKAGAPINGEESATTTVNRARRDDLVSVTALGFRISEVILCVISFSIMAADKTQGWSGDSYDRYKEYRYCLAVNVIAFVYSAFEACDAACYIAKESYMMNCGFHDLFVFSMDQLLAYLLMSASSCAATRVDDWVSNWGKDEFTQMATASIVVSFLAFGAFAVSALISSYRLFTHASS